MKIVITGATGMVGRGVLLECICDPDISEIVLINRSDMTFAHPKVSILTCKDWFNLTDIEPHLTQVDACFFCLGISAVGQSEDQYKKITYDLTLNFAKTLSRLSPNLTFCYVSGAGTDGTRPTRVMWKKIKGQTEEELRKTNTIKTYLFRPGYIHPMKGVKTKTLIYRLLYLLLTPLYPLFKWAFPKWVTSSVQVGQAMISVAKSGYSTPYLENSDINKLAG